MAEKQTIAESEQNEMNTLQPKKTPPEVKQLCATLQQDKVIRMLYVPIRKPRPFWTLEQSEAQCQRKNSAE